MLQIELAESEVLNARTLVRVAKQAVQETAENALASSHEHKSVQTRAERAASVQTGLEAQAKKQTELQEDARDEVTEKTDALEQLQKKLEEAQSSHQAASGEKDQLSEQFKLAQISKSDADRKQTGANHQLVSARASDEHATKETKQLKKDEQDAYNNVEALEAALKNAQAEVWSAVVNASC